MLNHGIYRDYSTGIFAIVRIVEAASVVHVPQTDGSFSSILGLMWAGMERNIAIMVASVPAMRPLAEPFTKLMTRTFAYGHKATPDPRGYEMGGSSKIQRIIDDSGPRLPAGDSLSRAETNKASQATDGSQERILPKQAHDHI